MRRQLQIIGRLDLIVITLIMSLFAVAEHAAAGQAQVAGSIVG